MIATSATDFKGRGTVHSPIFDRLLVVGLNSRTVPLCLRERLFAEAPENPQGILDALTAQGLGEGLLLATCERLELVALIPSYLEPERTLGHLVDILADQSGSESQALRSACYCLCGRDALRHLFAVSASLDSQVVGEPQILGQVKDALRFAKDHGAAGTVLSGFFQAAFTAAKKVRTQTTIAQQAVTLAASACRLAQDVHGDPARFSLLLMGGGEAAELLAREFMMTGLKQITVTHPRERRAQAMAVRLGAVRLGGQVETWGRCDELLVGHDVVLCGFHTAGVILDEPRIKSIMTRRRRKPLLIVDLADDGSVDGRVQAVDGVFLYRMDNLVSVARQGRARREAAMMDAWKILGAEMATLERAHRHRQAAPAIVAVRAHVEQLRQQVLEEQPDSAQQATHLLVNRLLHPVHTALREASLSGDEATFNQAVRRLFGLENPSNRD